jgi:hypothetical protein
MQNQDYVKGAEILGGLSDCQSVKKEPASVDFVESIAREIG